MLPLITTVFLASLFGSLHCAGMCGAFLTIALGGGVGKGPRFSAQAAYHGGRLVTYVALGTIAGGFGSALNLAGTLAGLQPIATALAAITIITFGIVSYLRLRGIAIPLHPPKILARLSSGGLRRTMSLHTHTRAAAIGLLTTLLPCGWLYAFVITSAGTGSPARGAVTMAVFWLGTLPVLVTLGTGLRTAFGSLGSRIPALTCAAMVIFGLLTLTGRLSLQPSKLLATTTTEKPACCEHKEGMH